MEWKFVFGVFCDHRVPMKLKGRFYNIYDQKVEKQSVKNRMQLK